MSAKQRRRRRLLPLLAVLALVGAYLYADAQDLVPGVLTTDEPWPEAEPFPEPQLPPAPDLSAFAAPPDAQAPMPTEPALAELTATLLNDDRVGPDPSVLVTDVATGEDLLDEGGSQGRTPASVLKVLTAVAALAQFGEEHTLTTQVRAGAVGQVVLVGGGDIALAAGAGDPEEVIGHAGLGDLADQVVDSLDGEDAVSVAVDDSLFTGPLLAPNWDDVDVAGGWAMPIMPIAVDLGRQEGTNARSEDPAIDAAEEFADQLRDRGVQVGEVTRGQAVTDVVLGEVSSAPMRDLVTHLMHYSDNPLSETLGRMVAHSTGAEPSFEGAGAAVLEVLADLGIDVEGVDLVETSGLSSLSDVTARVLTDTIRLAADGSHPELMALARSLPVGALEGTLSDRMGGTEAAGLVAAKTGTLPTVVTLSGLTTTSDGRLLAFTVMSSDFAQGGGYLARLAIDDWAARLAACGCD
ncbi:MAG TPA: D-alanyl-D-alanine carboxypeptidase/D-alanyl-D-alanine-endopeptidase [Beutenbergiaceae bacterium]|nr:D-alanyl-D-alanine carboxypeptidase/D-alanyl-D-alanine-endopeptidase [Beutenbergiaceae bacterium]